MTTSDRTSRQPLEVADIIQRYGDDYIEQHKLPLKHLKVMHHIRYCRTAVMGGHLQQCNQCGFERQAYNSCKDRHCPKCRTLSKERWLDARRSELLPTGYFHLVFTLPYDLNPVIHCNPRMLLNNLFDSVNETLQAFAADPKWRLMGQLGFVSVLHTWSQTLIDHYAIHLLIDKSKNTHLCAKSTMFSCNLPRQDYIKSIDKLMTKTGSVQHILSIIPSLLD